MAVFSVFGAATTAAVARYQISFLKKPLNILKHVLEQFREVYIFDNSVSYFITEPNYHYFPHDFVGDVEDV